MATKQHSAASLSERLTTSATVLNELADLCDWAWEETARRWVNHDRDPQYKTDDGEIVGVFSIYNLCYCNLDLYDLLHDVEFAVESGPTRRERFQTLLDAPLRLICWIEDEGDTRQRDPFRWVRGGANEDADAVVYGLREAAKYARSLAAMASPLHIHEESQQDESDSAQWIIISKAVPMLSFIGDGRRGLERFSKENPAKLRMRQHPNHPRRRQVYTPDIVRLQAEQNEKAFDELDDSTETIAKRMAEIRSKK